MNKILIVFAVTSILQVQALAQTLVAKVKSLHSEMWGYIDIDGKTIVSPMFDQCFPYSSVGLAAVYDRDNRQYYFIDLKGNRIKTEIKDFKLIDRMGFSLEDFSDGLIPVEIDNKWGFMNTQGKLVIPAEYDYVNGFGEGKSVVLKRKTFYILDTDGTALKLNTPEIKEVRKFSEGLAPFETIGGYGFINQEGQIVIKPRFKTVGYFKNGFAWARSDDGKLGFIDAEGSWVIKPQFSFAGNFDKTSGLARVKLGEKWHYVDKNGKLHRFSDTTVWEDFSEGLALGKKNGNFGFFNNTGEWIIEPSLDGARDFKNGYAAAKRGGKWGVIDTSGKWVITPAFMNVYDMELVDKSN